MLKAILDSSDKDKFISAQKAISQEYKQSIKWKKLRCRAVEQVNTDTSVSVLEKGSPQGTTDTSFLPFVSILAG